MSTCILHTSSWLIIFVLQSFPGRSQREHTKRDKYLFFLFRWFGFIMYTPLKTYTFTSCSCKLHIYTPHPYKGYTCLQGYRFNNNAFTWTYLYSKYVNMHVCKDIFVKYNYKPVSSLYNMIFIPYEMFRKHWL